MICENPKYNVNNGTAITAACANDAEGFTYAMVCIAMNWKYNRPVSDLSIGQDYCKHRITIHRLRG